MSKDVRIQLALDNWDEYVNTLTKLSDKELVKKLNLIDIQAQIAFKNKTSAQLLEIWWKQTVEARILKAENNIADAPNDIEIAIADIEAIVSKTKERQEIIESTQKFLKHKIIENTSGQTKLF